MVFCPMLGEGGADRVVAKLLRHLDRDRFAPSLALLRREGPFMSDVPRDVPIHILGARRLAVATPGLVRLLAHERPDIVFSTHGAANIVVAAAHVIARSRARLVLSERSALHRMDRSRARVAVELPAKRWTYRRADVVTAVSDGVARDLTAVLRLPPARIRVVHNPMVDDELSASAAEPVEHPWFDPSSRVPVVVAVGRLVEIKDYPTLLRAFARVRSVRAARLVVLGDGPLRAKLDGLVATLGLAGDVRFLGFDKNPYRYMARARLLLHASRAEGLPGALIQAMACRTPVVATDCDFGPREVVTEPGRNGFLVPIGDAEALADRALRLIASDELHERVAIESHWAVQRFTTAVSMAKYEAALAGQAAPS
jgi:glycosyltransferase involved in cell wall biosynthesis